MANQIKLNNLLRRIQIASNFELNQIIKLLLHTYSNRYPDQDIIFLSLPKNDPDERQRILDALNVLAFE